MEKIIHLYISQEEYLKKKYESNYIPQIDSKIDFFNVRLKVTSIIFKYSLDILIIECIMDSKNMINDKNIERLIEHYGFYK